MLFTKNKSMVCYSANPTANARIVCFPCAGGGASMYRTWSKYLPEREVWAATYPGRDSLREQPFAKSVDDIVALFANDANWFDEKPTVLYGHSFGSLVAFKLAYVLQTKGINIQGVCGSSRRAPHLETDVKISDLSEAKFMEKLNKFGGIPDAIRNNQDMMDFYLPIIRADLELNDYGISAPDEKVKCPIHIYSANNDKVATEDEYNAWKNVTTSYFQHKTFEGGHFFLQDDVERFMAALNATLATFAQDDDDDLIAF